MDRFAELYDQLTAYEDTPNDLHYTTRFLDGLKPGVRIAVALQKPKNLDAAYELALLHEELGEGFTPINIYSAKRMSAPAPITSPSIVKTAEEKRRTENAKPTEVKISGQR